MEARAARRGRRRIDARVEGRFIQALRDGATVQAAAEQAGCGLSSLYRARKRDPAVRQAWDDAVAWSAAPRLVRCANRRVYQLVRGRQARFCEERQRRFLAHFAATCDCKAACRAAGVGKTTVYRHRRLDPVFDAEWQRALRDGYARLEAEALRQQLAAQERLRHELLCPDEVQRDFDRTMRLLAHYRRRDGSIGIRTTRPTRGRRWTFEEAMVALDKRLRALGIPIVGAPRREARALGGPAEASAASEADEKVDPGSSPG